ncbi:MAG: asparagine--tRNA ligase [Candidatus Woesearchaeota archaeon]
MKEFQTIKEAMSQGKGRVNIRGWVYRERGNKNIQFIVLRDAQHIIQCVVEKLVVGEDMFEQASKVQIETAMSITGDIVADKRAPSGFEIKVKELEIIGDCDTFPIAKDNSPEFLLDIRHLALRTRKQAAILRIRSSYVQAREQFFKEKDFFRFDAPILQPNQSEGGSTLFSVNYYKEKTFLSQSWQLYAEAAVSALERIYNFGPTFRAEKSKTSRHLSEFWMAEMEAAWFDLNDIISFAFEELKFCIQQTVKERKEDFILLGQDPQALLEMCDKEWPVMKYREALSLIKEKENMDIPFGKDLRTEEEKALMNHFDTPVAVTHYPVKAMAFYKPRDPQFPDEALCVDILSPTGVEITGGSQRSMDIEDMKKRLQAEDEDPANYQWYFDTRIYGGVPHSGYGIGTERVIQWITGTENIKDCIPFPRTMLRWSP